MQIMTELQLTGCPELVDDVRCDAPTQIIGRAVMESTDGPTEHVQLLCAVRHRLFCLATSLETPDKSD